MRASRVFAVVLCAAAFSVAGCSTTKPGADDDRSIGEQQIDEGVWSVSRSGSPGLAAFSSVIRTGPNTYNEWWLVRGDQQFPLDRAQYVFTAIRDVGIPKSELCVNYSGLLGPNPRLFKHAVTQTESSCGE